MLLSKDGTRVISPENLLSEYGKVLTRGGPGGLKGETILRKKEKLNAICARCGREFSITYKSYLLRGGELCQKHSTESTKEERYGDPNFNNREKAFSTNREKYGSEGSPRKGVNSGIPKTWEVKEKIRRLAVERFRDKTKHPFYGKSHRPESNEKNRRTQLRLIEEGKRDFKSCGLSGVFLSKKYGEIPFRSSYELTVLNLIDKIQNLEYEYETLTIPYWHGEKEHRYIPDIKIGYRERTWVVEIKPKYYQEKSLFYSKREAAERYCRDRNWKFRVLDQGDFLRFVLTEINPEQRDLSSDFLLLLKESLRVVLEEEDYATLI